MEVWKYYIGLSCFDLEGLHLELSLMILLSWVFSSN